MFPTSSATRRAGPLALSLVLASSLADGCGLSSDSQPTPDALSAQALVGTRTSEFEATLQSLGPVAYYRLGETSGTTVHDASGRAHHGSYVNAPGHTSGAIAGDDDGAMLVRAVDRQYAELPDHDDFSLVKAQDAFGRVVAQGSSFGVLDHGGSWTPEFSRGAYYSCDGSSARIHQSVKGTFGQSVALARADLDVQVRVAWDDVARGGALRPLMLLARMQDESTYYMAELRENVGGQLDLTLRRTAQGVTSELHTVPNVGSYVAGRAWYVRMQLEGPQLRAKAWPADGAQPLSWLATASDHAIQGAGRVGLRSTNSGSSARPVVSFDDFRVQSLGMTVHAFVRVDEPAFTTEDNYLHWLGKSESGQHEWGFRIYSTLDTARSHRISAYAWNPRGILGAGAYFQDAAVAGQWLQVVAVYDAGDALDPNAGVAIFRDGERRKGPPSGATLYAHPDYRVFPGNGSAPLRLGTRDLTGFLTGAIDEVAVFDRKLSAAEIADLYDASRE